MFGKRTATFLSQVKVTFSKGGVLSHEKVIDVPPGVVFRCGFAEHPRLLNCNGSIYKVFKFESGNYDMEFEYIYQTVTV